MPFASPAAIADANVQPVPCVLRVCTRIDLNARYCFPSYSRSVDDASSSKCPPLITTARAPISTIRAAASRASSHDAILRSVSTSASGRFGVTTSASGSSSRTSALTASRSSSLWPPFATITGSTTRFSTRCSRIFAATVPMIAAFASIPVFTASAPMSLSTASICFATRSGGIASQSVTSRVFCAVTAVIADVP